MTSHGVQGTELIDWLVDRLTDWLGLMSFSTQKVNTQQPHQADKLLEKTPDQLTMNCKSKYSTHWGRNKMAAIF